MTFNKINFGMIRLVLMFALSVLNLLFMHAFFRYEGYLEILPYVFSAPVNFFLTVFDVSLVLLLFLALSWGRLKLSLSVSFFVTLIWSFVNVFYGGFFFQYLPLSAIAEAGSLTDGLVIDSMLSGFRWLHCFYLISLLAFLVVLKRAPSVRLSLKMWLAAFSVPVVCLFMVFIIYTARHFAHPMMRHNMELYKNTLREAFVEPDESKNSFPNRTRYHAGVVRILCSEFMDMFVERQLSQHEKEVIASVCSDKSGKCSGHKANKELKNVVFIVIESFLSAPSDLVIDGKEITPFLNSLKKDSAVYYNGHLSSNITIGESGDGQFIYMTGLLPLRHKPTVGEAKSKSLYALPKILKEHFGVKYAEIVLPTTTQMWQQEGMNAVYGIDRAYQNVDLVENRNQFLTDRQVFDLAMRTDKTSQQPFFSMVLTVDTHMPYREPVVQDFVLSDESYPETYRNYLIACHQVDRLIEAYFNDLKQKGIYDNSLIVILSDHHAHMYALEMGDKITQEIPLYIVNGDIDSSKAWKGKCNQLDVFTTILDVLGVDCEWKGLGRTLLTPDYINSVTPQKWDVSEWIIEGDYFGKTGH